MSLFETEQNAVRRALRAKDVKRIRGLAKACADDRSFIKDYEKMTKKSTYGMLQAQRGKTQRQSQRGTSNQVEPRLRIENGT